jgi:hypothetical protein
MISPGDNTVRVAGFKKGPFSIYEAYQFNLINLKGHTKGFCYAVPAGVRPPSIVRDLLELRERNLWFIIYLKEVGRELAIQTIKEPRAPQNELWKMAKKVV